MQCLVRVSALAAACCLLPAAAPAAGPEGAPVQQSLDAETAAYHAQAQAAVKNVLQRREFADMRGDPYAFWRQFSHWLGDLLGKVFAPLGFLPVWLFWFFLGCMILVLAAILAYLIYTLWSVLGGTPLWTGASGAVRRGHAGELLGIRELDFDAVYAEARRLLAAGDWAAAARHLYVAAILWLDRQGCVAFRLSKTNRDYLRELRGRANFQDRFRRLTDGFESIAYGGRPATAETGADMMQTMEGMFNEPAPAIAG